MNEFVCLSIVHHDGREYAAGERIELTEAAADALLRVRAIESAPEKSTPTKPAKPAKA